MKMTNSTGEESPAKRVSVWLREEDYPHSLNEEELRTPALVLRNLFSPLLRVCTMDRMTPLFDSHYFIALKKEHLHGVGDTSTLPF